jgi:hypothetical protein
MSQNIRRAIAFCFPEPFFISPLPFWCVYYVCMCVSFQIHPVCTASLTAYILLFFGHMYSSICRFLVVSLLLPSLAFHNTIPPPYLRSHTLSPLLACKVPCDVLYCRRLFIHLL